MVKRNDSTLKDKNSTTPTMYFPSNSKYTNASHLNTTINTLKSVLSWNSVFRKASNSLPSAFVSLFMVSSGDKLGRRLGFLVPTIMGFISACGICLIITLEGQSEYFIFTSLLNGCGGSIAALLGSSYAYTTDKTSVAHRSFRIYVIHQLSLIGVKVGISRNG